MASLMTIFRQVEREGRRWGLVPMMRDGKVSVCELVDEMVPCQEGGIVKTQKGMAVVASLDENSPADAFCSILLHRVQRHHRDFMKMVAIREEREREAANREMEERRRDMRAHWRAKFIRSRTLFVPGSAPLEPGLRR